MSVSQFDVVVVGAGAAGLTAAIALARAGFRVVVVEAAPFPGAENWSGCVYFCENLAHPEVLGPDGVEGLAWERRLVERGLFATDGHGLFGMTYRDPEAFHHCYTVLRPLFDHHLALCALAVGVVLLNSTTAECLIRDRGRVIGVGTSRGPLYGALVFLAEGDASQLVTREGYERSSDPRDAPRFLLGIKQIIELPPGAIEERFGVGAQEGVAHELLLRNGTLDGQPVHLNMGGFIYTNARSLSVGLVVPADNLTEHFGGDPGLLIEWLLRLPALRPWLDGGKRGAFGAKVIRGGGARDIPTLVDDGLAIGGAASAIGVDFPYPNFTGPATRMGLLLAQAARAIRAEGGDFTGEALTRHYLEPLKQSRHWQDVEFLRRWPGYVKRTTAFFDRTLDLALGSAYVWTRPRRFLFGRWRGWFHTLRQVGTSGGWGILGSDLGQLTRALRAREVAGHPPLWRFFLDGFLNALRDLLRRPRGNLPAGGDLQFRFTLAGGSETVGPPPRFLRNWFRRFRPVLAAAARRIYGNNDEPLVARLPAAVRLLQRQVNLFDILTVGSIALAAFLFNALAGLWRTTWRRLGLSRNEDRPGGYGDYAAQARRTTELTPAIDSSTAGAGTRFVGSVGGAAGRVWEDRLAPLVHPSTGRADVRLLWPLNLTLESRGVEGHPWHVCPAGVFEAGFGPDGPSRATVHPERCIKCEICWRSSNLVDWARDGEQQLVYPVSSPAVARLIETGDTTATARPTLPLTLDFWMARLAPLAVSLDTLQAPASIGNAPLAVIGLLERVSRKLEEFEESLARPPQTFGRNRIDYLEMLARYAQQLIALVLEDLGQWHWLRQAGEPCQVAHDELLALAREMLALAERRTQRTWDRRFSWAAADGRQLRQHHIPGLLRMLHLIFPEVTEREASPSNRRTLAVEALGTESAPWPASNDNAAAVLTGEQDARLTALLAQVPLLNPEGSGPLLHPRRRTVLAELARHDPWLAYRAASHLWARDLAGLFGLNEQARRWQAVEEWACLAVLNAQGEAVWVPARQSATLLLVPPGRLLVVRGFSAGISLEPLDLPGAGAAGLARVRLTEIPPAETEGRADPDALAHAWAILSGADLVSIAFGMADRLGTHVLAHGAPLLDQLDTGRIGAIKRLVAELGARRYLLETLDQALAPEDLSPQAARQAELMKAVAAEVIGGPCSSIACQAAQILGMTGVRGGDLLGRYFPATAALRFLGIPNREVYRRFGRERTASDCFHLDSLLKGIQLREGLRAEIQEVRSMQTRLDRAWTEMGLSAEASEAFVRQEALLLATGALLLRTHVRLEAGRETETEVILLRVWLDGVSASLAACVDRFRRQETVARPDHRPLIEPDAGPPLTRYEDFLRARVPCEPGDFLLHPIDLHAPRLVPEMIGVPRGQRIGVETSSFPQEEKVWVTQMVTAVASMDALVRNCGTAPADSTGQVPDGAVWRRERLEEETFTAAALAYDVLGRLGHSDARSLHLETAIARLQISEALRRVLGLVEEVDGVANRTGTFFNEEAIAAQRLAECDGVNEVLRYQILRILASEVAPRWARTEMPALRHVARPALELEATRANLRQRLGAALEAFGPGLWQDPDLQANCYLLAEATAWYKAADSTLGRLAWLARRDLAEDRDPGPEREIGRRAFVRCTGEVEQRLRRFDEELAHLRRGFYAPQVRAAELLCVRIQHEPQPEPLPVSRVSRPLSVLVIIESLARIQAHGVLASSDRSALEEALQLHDAAPELVNLRVLAVGPSTIAHSLREVLSLDVETVDLLVSPPASSPDQAASALAAFLADTGPFDLVLTGVKEESRLARLVAEALGIPVVGQAKRVSIEGEQVLLRRGSEPVESHPLPALVTIEAGLSLRPFTIASYLAGLSRSVRVHAGSPGLTR
jgi:electron transfer flavoprotein-quinone oxidoreductase